VISAFGGQTTAPGPGRKMLLKLQETVDTVVLMKNRQNQRIKWFIS
jgi:hypothetical protein